MDVSGNHSSEDVREEQSFATLLPEWARERADGRWYAPSAAGRPSEQEKTKAPAPANLILVVPDGGEDDWAKARVLDNPGQAAALAQTLVDGGLAPERMCIFSATQMVVDVGYKPMVRLTEGQEQKKSPGTA